jgi:hypothetical protein
LLFYLPNITRFVLFLFFIIAFVDSESWVLVLW